MVLPLPSLIVAAIFSGWGGVCEAGTQTVNLVSVLASYSQKYVYTENYSCIIVTLGVCCESHQHTVIMILKLSNELHLLCCGFLLGKICFFLLDPYIML